MKEVIVVGLGNTFKRLENTIKKRWKIIAVSDSCYSDKKDKYGEYLYYPIAELRRVANGCDIFICCTQRYYFQLYEELTKKHGISADTVMDCFAVEEMEINRLRDGMNYRLEKFNNDYEMYLKCNYKKFTADRNNIWPLLFEYDNSGSSPNPFYFSFEDWCSKYIYKHRPEIHYDIGGRIDGFISRLLTFGQKVKMVDYRPINIKLEGLEFLQGDVTKTLNNIGTNIMSLSCLGCVESFGLGRWGDDVDPLAWEKGLKNMQEVMAEGGYLYIAVPIGKERLEFNARRVFSPQTIIDTLEKMQLVEFCIANPEKFVVEKSDNLDFYNNYDGSNQIIGCFLFEKKMK